MMHRMWDKEPLIPTSYTPRYKQILKAPPQIYFRDFVKQLVAPLIPSPKCVPFKVTELVTPAVAYFGLVLLLFNFKSAKSDFPAALLSVTLYMILVPAGTYLLCLAGKAPLSFAKVFSVVTASQIGTLLTLLVPIVISHENAFKSHVPFLVALAIFGGLTTARVCLVLIVALPVPVMRLITGTVVALTNLFFMLFLHFAFMHPTFKYGIGAYKSSF
ncbi:protein YIPF3-like [Cloeon dipterum]|uniref:protein YIPF3-like n=1 Tax=Cloeon dipterum TaxID=197152 RepID=UPI0032201B39